MTCHLTSTLAVKFLCHHRGSIVVVDDVQAPAGPRSPSQVPPGPPRTSTRQVINFRIGEVLVNPTLSRRVAHLLAALMVGGSALMAGCAQPQYPSAPALAGVGDYTYIIGAGDNLNIIVWRNPELSMSVPVRPDGKVAAPLVEEIVAQGKTSTELARDIEQQLSKYVRDPVVTVLITAFVGPYSEQIRVIGEAARPQFLNYKKDMTLLDVMIAVGGLTDFAAGNSASILRTGEGGKQYAVRLKDLVKRGDVSANVGMKPGDILVIPQSLF